MHVLVSPPLKAAAQADFAHELGAMTFSKSGCLVVSIPSDIVQPCTPSGSAVNTTRREKFYLILFDLFKARFHLIL